jgi:hypothetical protein
MQAAATSASNTVARVTVFRIALLACALCVGGAACGGSDESSSSSETTTTATTSGAGANERLSASEWASYQTALANAQAVNVNATKKFAGCRNLMGTNADAEKIKTCLGNSTSQVVAQGQKFLDIIEGFDVSGACADAQMELVNYVRAYVSSVNGMNRSLAAGSTASLDASQTNAVQGLTDARKSGPRFAAACKPL